VTRARRRRRRLGIAAAVLYAVAVLVVLLPTRIEQEGPNDVTAGQTVRCPSSIVGWARRDDGEGCQERARKRIALGAMVLVVFVVPLGVAYLAAAAAAGPDERTDDD
jgi:hypothetical protein